MKFYEKSEILLPDNWMHNNQFLNVPLDEFMEIINFALNNGFTMVFDLDHSPFFYNYFENSKGWIELPENLEKGGITQDIRDERFENWITTDKHLVQAYGIVRDQNNKTYYMIKDSVGPIHAKMYNYEKIYPIEKKE